MLRRIVERLYGDVHAETNGLVRTLFTPKGHGRDLRPFIYLDLLRGRVAPKHDRHWNGFGLHPHSGMATLTVQKGIDMTYVDFEGREGVLRDGGIEYMVAGGGAWHASHFAPEGGDALGMQLWISLPPSLEDGPSYSQMIDPERVPTTTTNRGDGDVSVRVMLGSLNGVRSPLSDAAVDNIDYFDVTIPRGRTFTHDFPATHKTSWAIVYDGDAEFSGDRVSSADGDNDRVLMLSKDGSRVVVTADGTTDARMILASAVPHPYQLIARNTSCHTNQASLDAARRRIKEIGNRLHLQGKI